MSTTIYLEAEDEITAAVGRIRALRDDDAVLVLSRSSRIGSSRINFKLLAREAHQQDVNLVVVSDEPIVRALAVSAGLPAYDSVAAAEEALAHFARQDEQLGRRRGRLPAEPRPRGQAPHAGAGVATPPVTQAPRPAGRATPPVTGTTPPRGQATPRPGQATPPLAEGTPTPTEATSPAVEATRILPPVDDEARRSSADSRTPASAPATGGRARRRRRLPLVPLLTLGLLAALIAAGLYAAYLYLPTASVTLRLHSQQFGPIPVEVTADPAVGVADAAAGVIPAERIRIPLQVSGEFVATGTEVSRSHASGRVRFTSENTLFDVPIPAGTVVTTADGTQFETTTSVSVPRASFESGPTTVTADIRATAPGRRGNVPAEAISELPADLAAALISVTNPRPTSGGSRQTQPVVTQEDYDAAAAELSLGLSSELRTRLADPATTPRGLTIYPTTVTTEEPRASPPAGEVVGLLADEFELTLETTATVLAVNEMLVAQVAAERLRNGLPAGQTMIGESVETKHAAGEVEGTRIIYAVSATARVYRQPDREAILASLPGKTVSEAQAILDDHGTAEISVWPDVVDRLPEQAARINLTILPPQESP